MNLNCNLVKIVGNCHFERKARNYMKTIKRVLSNWAVRMRIAWNRLRIVSSGEV
jgi:hypothetical protein